MPAAPSRFGPLALLVILVAAAVWRFGGGAPQEVGPGPSGPPTVDGVLPSELEVTVEPGSAGALAELESAPREVEAAPVPALAEVRLFGDVRRTNGEPVPRGFLILTDGWTSYRINFKGGKWEKGGVTPGTWLVRLQASGCRRVEREVIVGDTEPEQRVDFEVEGSIKLDIIVRKPNGELQPSFVAGATPVAVATRDIPGERLPRAFGDTHERFGLGEYDSPSLGFGGFGGGEWAGVSGRLELFEPLPAFVSLVLRDTVVDTVQVPIGGTSAEFQLTDDRAKELMGDLVVRLFRAEDGQRLAGAKVQISTAETGWPSRTSNENGYMQWRDMETGLMHLVITASGRATLRRYVDIEPGGSTVDLTMPLARAISGRVVDAQGEPARCNVMLVPQHELHDVVAFDVRHSQQVAADGTFTLKNVEPGRFWLRGLRAHNTFWPTGVAIDTTDGDVEGVVVRLARASRVRLEFELSRAWRYGWAVRDADGYYRAWGHVTRTGLAGTELEDGEYTLELRDGAEVLRTVAFDVTGRSRVLLQY